MVDRGSLKQEILRLAGVAAGLKAQSQFDVRLSVVMVQSERRAEKPYCMAFVQLGQAHIVRRIVGRKEDRRANRFCRVLPEE